MSLLGALGVGVIGLAIMLAIVVAKARAGYFTFSLGDLVAVRLETLPVLAGLLFGGVAGYRRPLSLDRAALHGFIALAPGAVAGSVAGWLLWGAGEGPWAGGIIGGSVGLVAGTVSAFRPARREAWPLRSGLAGATSLLALGALGAIGIAGARDIAPIEFEAVEAAALPPPSDVDAVAFLVGDAGDATVETSPLLHALQADVERWSAALGKDSAASVLFLGDNVYPSGVHDREHPRFPEDSTRLWSQIRLVGGEAAKRHATIGLFTTGNHDWGNTTGDTGLERVRNLEEQLGLAREPGYRVALLPAAGTPGPTVRDLRDNVRILFLDTHWFLQQRSRAEHSLFFARLQAALDGAGDREVIIVAHHPFRTAGPHGVVIPGYHSGGIEYLLKRSGSLVQDLNSPVYADLLAGLVSTFEAAPRPPLVFAGGHDHSLQVFEGVGRRDPRFSIVSGAGSKISGLSESEGLVWGGSRPGWMMLVFRKDDGVDLFVIAGDPDRLSCTGPLESDAECMVAGRNAFEVVYSATLLGPAGRDQPIPEADVDTTVDTVVRSMKAPAGAS
jgi:hypothetical protein